ncbi:MAG: hypothetical protein R3277_03120 [Brumimicrobium sp.]|nr:hypothetical protein [Brumimicrobium sp.]
MEQTKILIIILLFVYGCGRKIVDLSHEEKTVLKKISNIHGCSAVLELDYESIRKKTTTGKYFLKLSFRVERQFCKMDSLGRASIMKDAKNRLEPVLSHSTKHDKLTISLKQMNNVKNGHQSAACIERYTFSLSNDSLTGYYREINGDVYKM